MRKLQLIMGTLVVAPCVAALGWFTLLGVYNLTGWLDRHADIKDVIGLSICGGFCILVAAMLVHSVIEFTEKKAVPVRPSTRAKRFKPNTTEFEKAYLRSRTKKGLKK